MRKITELRFTCENCGARFNREKSGNRPIRFCGSACYHAWNRENGSGGGRFAKGLEPWNKGLKGIHLSPDSEWKKGQAARNHLPVGSITIRHRQRESQPRAFVKIAEPNTWQLRAIYVWEQHHGKKVPFGMVIHHKDRNALNDAIDNLQAMTRAEHIEEHRQEFRAAA